jgi:fructose-specific component phosphotransferase system IIB-like protein
MKCIKNNKTGEIERVADKEAYNRVGNAWSYVAKNEWKAATRKVKVNEVVETKSEADGETIAEKQLKGKKKKVKDEKGK